MGMINIRVIVYGLCRQRVIKVNYKRGQGQGFNMILIIKVGGYMGETLDGLIVIGVIYDMSQGLGVSIYRLQGLEARFYID